MSELAVTNLRGLDLDVLLADDSPAVSRQISPNDVMHRDDPARYFYWGREAVRCVVRALDWLGKAEVRSILDLPSGHGRVLRMFNTAFPDAHVTACDLDPDAVDFCVEAFGALPAYSHVDPSQIKLGGEYDLIWCGSLFTHLDHPRWAEFCDLFGSLLADDGILVFTTHGPRVASEIRAGKVSFLLPRPDDLLRAFEYDGFAYQDYVSQTGYGISLSSPGWVCRFLERRGVLSVGAYVAGGWSQWQDAFVCVPA